MPAAIPVPDLAGPFVTVREFDKMETKVDGLSRDLTRLETSVSHTAVEQTKKLDMLIEKDRQREEREIRRDQNIKSAVRLWSLLTGGGGLMIYGGLQWWFHGAPHP
ncbi:hypothetical protein GOB93_03360 [Acetobacter musti]|uniref:Uncharacterized protein n=1 Tax=Acetobacter musti TaxID=864732 RepID=A0ABX0JJE4_9PROT|nr:hypothetical protein [Acetobacter musti]NHN83678.1 hypothetical protein [Acetobacter musti]